MAKIAIDFSVHSSPYYLKVVDLSVWGVITDRPAIIKIQLPGYEKEVTKFFDKNKLNVLNSNILGTGCEDDLSLVTLSDGIYIITVTGSPETYTKTYKYLKTDLLNMEIDKIYIDNIDIMETASFEKNMTRIEFLLKGAEAHIRYDNMAKAASMFEKAQELVEDMLECTTCE